MRELLTLLTRCDFVCGMAGHPPHPGILHCVPHGDGSQRVFIAVPAGHESLPSGAYFVPACMPSKVQRKLLGQLSKRSISSAWEWVHPRALAAYLVAVGYPDVSRILMGAQGDAQAPLLSREALRDLGRVDLWPAQWAPLLAPLAGLAPQPPQLGIQILHVDAGLQVPGPVGSRPTSDPIFPWDPFMDM